MQPLPGSPVTSPEPGCGKAPPQPPSSASTWPGPSSSITCAARRSSAPPIIRAIVRDRGEVEAELWEIAENLHPGRTHQTGEGPIAGELDQAG